MEKPAAEVWGDIWGVIGPQLAEVMRTGKGFSTLDQFLPIRRDGRVSETYWNYSFTPIRSEDGHVMGVFTQAHEITDRILDERRSRFLLELSDRLRALSNPRSIIDAARAWLPRGIGSMFRPGQKPPIAAEKLRSRPAEAEANPFPLRRS